MRNISKVPLQKAMMIAAVSVLASACSDVEFLGVPLNESNQAGQTGSNGNTASGAGYGYSTAPTASGPVGEYKVGKPYVVNGRSFTPAENYGYSATGNASWYGEEFRGESTSNGEIFNPDALTAAHPTLPMPSMVRVTNLENGRQVAVRINDRGPFVPGRIIDVSRRAAEMLGFAHKGVAQVRVDMMADESRKLKAEALGARGGNSYAGNRWTPAPGSNSGGMSQPVQTQTAMTPSGYNGGYQPAGNSSNQPVQRSTISTSPNYQPAPAAQSVPSQPVQTWNGSTSGYGSASGNGMTGGQYQQPAANSYQPAGNSYQPAGQPAGNSAPLPLSQPVPQRTGYNGNAANGYGSQASNNSQNGYNGNGNMTPVQTASAQPTTMPVPQGTGPDYPAANGVQALPSDEAGYRPTEMWPLWPPLPGEQPSGPISIADLNGSRPAAGAGAAGGDSRASDPGYQIASAPIQAVSHQPSGQAPAGQDGYQAPFGDYAAANEPRMASGQEPVTQVEIAQAPQPVTPAASRPQTASLPAGEVVTGMSQDSSPYGAGDIPMELPPVSENSSRPYDPWDDKPNNSGEGMQGTASSASYGVPQSASTPMPAGDGAMFIQAGAFASESNARRLQQKLSGVHAADIVPAMVNGMQFYRVRVGPFNQDDHARAALSRIVDSGYAGARLVRN